MARGGYRHYLNRQLAARKITEAEYKQKLQRFHIWAARKGYAVAPFAQSMSAPRTGGGPLSPREQTIAQRRSQPYPKKPPEVAAREDKQIREARQRQMGGSIPAGRGWVGSKDELETMYGWKKKKAIGHTGTGTQHRKVQQRIAQWFHGKEDVREELLRAEDNLDADKPAFSGFRGVVGVESAEFANKHFERAQRRRDNAERTEAKWGGHVMPHKRHRVVASDIDLPGEKTVQPVGPVDPLDPRVPEPVREKAHVFVPAGSKWEKSYINKKARRGLQKQAARQKIWKRANARSMERKRRLWLRGLKRNPYV